MYYLVYGLSGQLTRSQLTPPTLGVDESVLEVPVSPSGYQAFMHPAAWQVRDGALLQMPYFAVAQSVANSITTLTALVVNPPSTVPPTATVTIGTSVVTVPLTSDSASITVKLHESLASFSTSMQFSAAGIIAAVGTVGTGSKAPVGVQAIAPTTSGEPYVIAPVGTGSLGFIAAISLGLSPDYADVAAIIMNMASATIQVRSSSPSLATPWNTVQTHLSTYQTAIGSLPGLK